MSANALAAAVAAAAHAGRRQCVFPDLRDIAALDVEWDNADDRSELFLLVRAVSHPICIRLPEPAFAGKDT